MLELKNLPPQQLPFRAKTKEWRKRHLLWADSKTFFNYGLVRRSVLHKKINYDLINGKLHMPDLEVILNPDSFSTGYIPENIQHYPIMNSKLNVLKGEEAKRIFDYRVVITNPNAISEIEENKKNELFQLIQEQIQNTSQSEEEFNQRLQEINDYFMYTWKDIREIRANALINHYSKELSFGLTFNNGFMDAMTVGEEIYRCDIVGGEPTLERINPMKLRIFSSGFSSRIEDADIIIYEDYWSVGRIIDTFYDVLTQSDIKYLDNIPAYESSTTDGMDNHDERNSFMLSPFTDTNEDIFDMYSIFSGTGIPNTLYYDGAGNVRVLQVFWKSKRKIKKVKSYDPLTGEEEYHFYPETYIVRKDRGEEEQILWINESWEGTMIGKEIFCNMRPRLVQYNRLSNPSRCHHGFIGSVYNVNEQKVFSLVDMMKPYNYYYDAIHDRLNKAMAANWGPLLEIDFANVPKGWDMEKWLYYAKTSHILVKDSFKEGNVGQATGKLAGNFAANTRGGINLDTGNYIQQLINLLEFIKMEMAEVAGISKQREGQTSSRETVGGIERAVLQSSHITEWLFTIHDDVKKRAIECFLETAKIALKGRSLKFQYILPDLTTKVMEIDGDEFAECDYGLVVDNSEGTQKLNSQLETLAQAALQNQSISFSTLIKLYNSSSIAEKERMIEKSEREMIERQQQAAQAEQEAQAQAIQTQAAMKEQELMQKDQQNQRDNETKLLIAQMQQFAKTETSEDVDYSPENKAKLEEQIREFNETLKLNRDKFDFERKAHGDDIEVKKMAIRNKPKTSTK